MNWEETILFARTKPEFKELISQAYLENELELNVLRFMASEEFSETLKLIDQHIPGAKRIADLGAGNGVASIAFAMKGFEVISVEPDPSATVGCGAIEEQKRKLNLTSLTILNESGENISVERAYCDVVYVRQALHHASDLIQFVSEAARVLRYGGLFLGIREHLVYNEKDKLRFLESHPFQKYYGGENAYTLEEYLGAIRNAGLKIIHVYKYFDSVINYYPDGKDRLNLKNLLKNKIGKLSELKFAQLLYKKYLEIKLGKLFEEKQIPGRMYSFIALKPD